PTNGPAGPDGGTARPVVTLTSASGRVVGVRASPLTGGTAEGTVAFPDKGPWHATISYRGRTIQSPEEDRSPGFSVGTQVGRDDSLMEVMRPPAQAAAPQPSGGFTWWPLLLALPLIGGATWLIRRRRPRPGGQL